MATKTKGSKTRLSVPAKKPAARKRSSPRTVKKSALKKSTRKRVPAVPARYRTVNAHLWVKNTDEALAYYAKGLGAKVVAVMRGPGGKGVMHAEMRVGDTVVMLADEWPGIHERAPASAQATTASLYCYVPNCDTAYSRAIQAGGKEIFPLADMFWGDRMGKFQDPFGHVWTIATHKEDPTPKEIARRQEHWFASMNRPG